MSPDAMQKIFTRLDELIQESQDIAKKIRDYKVPTELPFGSIPSLCGDNDAISITVLKRSDSVIKLLFTLSPNSSVTTHYHPDCIEKLDILEGSCVDIISGAYLVGEKDRSGMNTNLDVKSSIVFQPYEQHQVVAGESGMVAIATIIKT